MVHCKISELHQHAHLHPNFRSLFNLLEILCQESLQPGHIEIDGHYIFINIDTVAGRTPEESPLESHQRYIDIQIPLNGPETFGYKPTDHCSDIKLAFDADRDIAFYNDKPSELITVNPGEAIIFFPEDAHAPCITTNKEHFKMVLKVSVQPNTEIPKL